MTKGPSWKTVADILGRRMAAHAFCDDHLQSKPADDCPFCDDRRAYQIYVEKQIRMRQ